MPHKPIWGLTELVSSTDRRDIFGFEPDDVDLSQTRFMIKKERAIGGNHYHPNATETFAYSEGGGLIVLQEVDRKRGSLIGERQVVPIHPPPDKDFVIIVPPFWAHTTVLQHGTVLRCHTDCNAKKVKAIPVPLVDEAEAALLFSKHGREE